MKKLLKGLILGLLLISLSSCDDIDSYENGVTLRIPASIQEYLVYQGTLPTLEFGYPGIVNVAKSSDGSHYYFGKNDYYLFSDAYLQHLAIFEDRFIITSDVKQEYDKTHAKFGNEKLVIDENTGGSFEQMMVAWDLQGNRFSYHYRTFISEGKRYYVYPYTSPIAATMEIPLMVIKQSGHKNNHLVLLNLPFDTKYEVNINIKTDKMIFKDEYLASKYYRFTYPNSLNELTTNQKQEEVLNWYKTYCDVISEATGEITYQYLGNLFKTVVGETSFEITWEGVYVN